MRRVAILSYNNNKYSETFIHNMVKNLPADKYVLYGGALPDYDNEGRKFLNTAGLNGVLVALKEWRGAPATKQHQRQIEKYLLQNKIETVVANYAITAFPVMEICRRNGIPLVVHFHGWTAYRSSLINAHRNDYKRMFEIAAAIIAVSADMREQLLALGAPPQKLHTITYGFNPQYFTYTDHSANANRFLSIGRFCDTKNPHLTLLAFSRVLQKVPGARLVMAGGDENLLNACVSLARALKIDDAVDFAGVLSPDEIAAEMKKALCFVQHSATTIQGEKEGTPVTILEACAAGLPVVATRHAGIKDVILDGETGLLVDEFDIDNMAACMVQLAQQRTMVKNLGLKASERVHAHFSMQQYIDKLWTVISNSIDGAK